MASTLKRERNLGIAAGLAALLVLALAAPDEPGAARASS